MSAQESDTDLVLLTYNREDTIEKSLESLSSQTYAFRNVICVDHHSEDSTVKIVKDFFPKVEIYYEDKGLGFARTLGISKVKSEFLFFLDSDVVLPAKFLTSLRSLFLSEEKIGAAQGKRHMNHPLWGKIIESRSGGGRQKRFRILGSQDRPFTGATLLRTGLCQGVDLSPYAMWEDYFLMRHVQTVGYLWLEAFLAVETLAAKVAAYGELEEKSEENEGAAIRIYGIKSPVQFFLGQAKYSARDLYYAVKLGDPRWINYVYLLHKSQTKGFLSPSRYLRSRRFSS